MATPQELERLRLEAEADADYEFEQAQKAKAAPPKPAAPVIKPPQWVSNLMQPGVPKTVEGGAIPKAPVKAKVYEEPVGPVLPMDALAGLPEGEVRPSTAPAGMEGAESPLVDKKTTTVWSPTSAVRGMASGALRGALGDTTLTRGIEAVRKVSEAIPTPVEAIALAANELADKAGYRVLPSLTGPSVEARIAKATKAIESVPGAKNAIMDVDEAMRTQDAAAAANKLERESLQLGGNALDRPVQFLRNAGIDLTNVARGMIDLGTQVLAPTTVYEGQTHGDQAFGTGKEMGESMPGQLLDLGKGLLAGEQSSFATKPFSTWMMLVDPVIRGAGATSAGRAAGRALTKTYATTVARPLISSIIDDMGSKFGWTKDLQIAAKRAFEDGIIQRDPRMTAMLEETLYGSERHADAIRNIAEQAARQMEQGKVVPREAVTAPATPEQAKAQNTTRFERNMEAAARAQERRGAPPELVPSKATFTPRGNVAEAARAAREAAELETEAGVAGGIADAAAQAATEARGVGRDVRSAQRMADVREARIADAALDDLTSPTPMTRGARRLAAQAGKAGVEVAERVKALDTAAAEGMSIETAKLARQPARAAERAAAEAALDAEIAGQRPTVNLGEVYVPEERAAAGGTTFMEDRRSVLGPSGDLAERFPELEKPVRLGIERAAEQASAAKAVAEEALGGIDLMEQPVNATAAEGLSNVADLYEAAREQAARLNTRNVSDLPAVLTATVRQLVDRNAVKPEVAAAIDRAAPAIADWLYKEVVAENMLRQIEPRVSEAIRRPTPEVVRMEAMSGGQFIDKPAYQRGLAERQRAVDAAKVEAKNLDNQIAAAQSLGAPPDEIAALQKQRSKLVTELPVGAAMRASDELNLARSVKLDPEAPKGFRSGNTIWDKATNRIAEIMREQGYFPDERAPGVEVATNPITFDLSGEPVGVLEFVQQANDDIKRLTKERVGQRFMEVAENDTTQLVRSRAVRAEMLKEFRKRAIEAGFNDFGTGNFAEMPLSRLLGEFNQRLLEPNRTGATSKNRFFEVYTPDGKALWTRSDWAKTLEKMPPEQMAKIRAEVVRDISDEIASAVQARNTTLNLYNEINRFRRDANGNVITDTLGNVNAYAKEVADRVLNQGEVDPMLMPFSGQQVADALRANADDYGVPRQQVLRLADRLSRYEAAAKEGGLNDTFSSYYKGVFHNTATLPELINVHVNPGAAKSLKSHFAMLASNDAIGAIPAIFRELSQRAKGGVVAMNLKSLVNNDLSNFVLNTIRRGDPMMAFNLPKTIWEWKQVKDGNLKAVSPAQARMYKALQQTNIVNGAQVSRDIGKSRLMEVLSKNAPEAARTAAMVDAATTGGIFDLPKAALGQFPRLQETLTKMYTDLGDAPFRIEDAVATFNDAMKKVEVMEQGSTMDVPVGRERFVRLERVGDGVTITDASSPRARRGEPGVAGYRVSLKSPELAKVLADNANYAQERVFYDYSKIGNYGKQLRGGSLAILSGIFSWFFKAMDVPGFKRGAVTEMMSQPGIYKTTSQAVKAMQAEQAAGRAARRAAVQAAGYSLLTDERQMDELARALGMNRTTASAIFDIASAMRPALTANPLNIVYRNTEPLLFTSPTTVAAGGLEAALDWWSHSDLYDNPVALAKILDANEADMTPDQRAVRKQVERVVRGEQFNPKQFLQIMGLGGGPLLNILQKMQIAEAGGMPFTAADGIKEFATQMFGATPAAAADVAAGILGQAGMDSVGRWSGYGREQVKHGMHGGTTEADMAGFTAYAVRQLLGLGALSQYAGLDSARSEATGRQRWGRLDTAKLLVSKQLSQMLTKPAEQEAERLRVIANNDPTYQNEQAAQNAEELYRGVKTTVARELKKYEQALREQSGRVRDGK